VTTGNVLKERRAHRERGRMGSSLTFVPRLTPFRLATFSAVRFASTAELFLKFPRSCSRGTWSTRDAARLGKSISPRSTSFSRRTSTTTTFFLFKTSSYASTGRTEERRGRVRAKRQGNCPYKQTSGWSSGVRQSLELKGVAMCRDWIEREGWWAERNERREVKSFRTRRRARSLGDKQNSARWHAPDPA